MSQIILALIVANVLVSVKGFGDVAFFERFKFQVAKIQSGEKFRMFSSAFLHANWLHLGLNMYALWLFGKIVIDNFSTLNFLIIYFGSLLAGSLYSLQKHKSEPFYSAIGASGAVLGIVFSAIVLAPSMELIMLPIPIPLPGYIFGIGYLLYSIYGMKNQTGSVGHAAHLGGAIAGYSLTLLLKPATLQSNTLTISAIGFIIVALLLFGDKFNPTKK